MAKTRATSKVQKGKTKKRGAEDKVFMKNLSAAVQDEFRKEARAAARAGVMSAPGRLVSPAAPRPAARTRSAEAAKPARSTRAGGTRTSKAAETAEKERLLKELRSIIGKLDVEGLSFLLEQAHVHLYNMEVDRINEFRSGREEKEAASSPPAPALRIERSESGSSYYIAAGKAYPMFTGPEMLALVRLAHGNEDEGDAARALIKWMGRERSDALNELGGANIAFFTELARALKKGFRDPGQAGR